jgi:hypothetical protein
VCSTQVTTATTHTQSEQISTGNQLTADQGAALPHQHTPCQHLQHPLALLLLLLLLRLLAQQQQSTLAAAAANPQQQACC